MRVFSIKSPDSLNNPVQPLRVPHAAKYASRRHIAFQFFYNAGLQVFDVSDTENPEIVAYFVPRFDEKRVVSYAMRKLLRGVYIEYDRNLF